MLTSLNNADRERRKLDHNEQCGTACLQGEFASTRRRVPEAVGFGDLQPHVNLGTCPADHSTGDQSRGGRGGYVGTATISVETVLRPISAFLRAGASPASGLEIGHWPLRVQR